MIASEIADAQTIAEHAAQHQRAPIRQRVGDPRPNPRVREEAPDDQVESAASLTHCPGLSLNLRGARGDVDFEPSRTRFFRGGNAWMPSLDGATRFIGIEDAADVFRMAQSASARD